ncbi:MAG: histidinol dehydrogenase [Devosiaceae bacterium]|nr:histidinol dehydrogenase [Devosiaceae bacterium]
MPLILNINDNDFEGGFSSLLEVGMDISQDVRETVTDIIIDVRKNGDEALLKYNKKFDNYDVDIENLRFSKAEIENALKQVPKDIIDALKIAYERIYSHHKKQLPKSDIYQDELGVTLGTKWSAIEAVGLYVPGGLASYPSSVLMNAIPAKIAGVKRLVMVVPTPNGEVNPAVLAAASICGIDEIYRLGGAQAIAALAYGTKTFKPIDKIVGPGNAYVAEAKRQVFGQVGIDMIAGPSEVLIIADKSANPAWVAADLLAQSEHGAGARSILITTEKDLAQKVLEEVSQQVSTLSRKDITLDAWEKYGAIIEVNVLDEAFNLANKLASEHVELALEEPEKYLPKITNAGAIFLGHYTPEAIGDYVGGSNHVLPTARSARFASGLGVIDFMKRTSILGCDSSSLNVLAKPTIILANTEGLSAHARSVSIRTNQ